MIRECPIVFWNSDQVVNKKEIKEVEKCNQMGPDVDGFIGQQKQAKAQLKQTE